MLKNLVNLTGAIAVIGLAAWPFMQLPSDTPEAPQDVMQNSSALPCLMDEPGRLQAALFGSIQQETDLSGDNLLCGGDYNQRIRLVFTGSNSTELANITLILSINAELTEQQQRDVATNITVMNTATGEFFSAQSSDRCWSDIELVKLVSEGTQDLWKASGTSYCAGALPQVAGRGSVTVGKLNFSGRMVDIRAN